MSIASASAASTSTDPTRAARSAISGAMRTSVRRPSRGSLAVSSAPRARSRATDWDTWLCGSPVRAAISPIELSGCSPTSITIRCIYNDASQIRSSPT
jgi:hypothetical protein